jgi:hypothetical protein
LVDSADPADELTVELTGPVNLGNPREFTVRQLAEMVIALTGSRSKIEFRPLPIDDPKQRQPDISLARKALEWGPKTELEAGLKAPSNISEFELLAHPVSQTDIYKFTTQLRSKIRNWLRHNFSVIITVQIRSASRRRRRSSEILRCGMLGGRAGGGVQGMISRCNSWIAHTGSRSTKLVGDCDGAELSGVQCDRVGDIG